MAALTPLESLELRKLLRARRLELIEKNRTQFINKIAKTPVGLSTNVFTGTTVVQSKSSVPVGQYSEEMIKVLAERGGGYTFDFIRADILKKYKVNLTNDSEFINYYPWKNLIKVNNQYYTKDYLDGIQSALSSLASPAGYVGKFIESVPSVFKVEVTNNPLVDLAKYTTFDREPLTKSFWNYKTNSESYKTLYKKPGVTTKIVSLGIQGVGKDRKFAFREEQVQNDRYFVKEQKFKFKVTGLKPLTKHFLRTGGGDVNKILTVQDLARENIPVLWQSPGPPPGSDDYEYFISAQRSGAIYWNADAGQWRKVGTDEPFTSFYWSSEKGDIEFTYYHRVLTDFYEYRDLSELEGGLTNASSKYAYLNTNRKKIMLFGVNSFTRAIGGSFFNDPYSDSYAITEINIAPKNTWNVSAFTSGVHYFL